MDETVKRQRSLALVKRLESPGWFKFAVPVVSIIGGFMFSALFLLAAGESPLKVYAVMFGGAFGSLYGPVSYTHLDVYKRQDHLYRPAAQM